MPTLDLYTQSAKSYSSGAKDTGNGVGLPKVSPLLATWVQTSAPPNGWGTDLNLGIVDAWCHGGYFYAVVNETGGTGAGIYRYELDTSSDPISMSYDDYVPIADLGLSGTKFLNRRAVIYDSSEEAVLICTYGTSGTVTPVCGKWLMSSWPFDMDTAVWKNVSQTTGSYVANNVIDTYIPFLSTGLGYVYFSSLGSGNVISHSWSDGSLGGDKTFYTGYSSSYPMWIFGRYSSTLLVAGGYRATQTSGASKQFLVHNPTYWEAITEVLSAHSSYDHGFGKQYNHTRNLLLGSAYKAYPLQENEVNALDFTTNYGWTNNDNIVMYFEGDPYGSNSGVCLVAIDIVGTTYQEVALQTNSSYSRSGHGMTINNSPFGFVVIDSSPWFLGGNDGLKVMYSEDSRGPKYTKGVAATFAGVGRVDYTFTATSKQTPSNILLGVGTNGEFSMVYNSEHSDHFGKHRFAISINGGAFYDYRSGGTELANLSAQINSKVAWPTINSGDTVVLRHEMSSGISGNFNLAYGNSEAVTEIVPVADFGPPRDIKVKFNTDYVEMGGGLF